MAGTQDELEQALGLDDDFAKYLDESADDFIDEDEEEAEKGLLGAAALLATPSPMHAGSFALPTHSAEGPEFCHAGNVAECMRYVSARLESFGLTAAPLSMPATDTAQQCAIVNCLYRLLDSRTKEMDAREEHESKLQALSLQEEKATARVKALTAELEKAKHDVRVQREQVRISNEKERRARERARIQMERLEKDIKTLKWREGQFKHEMKKKELEYERIKERLQKLMAEKSKSMQTTIELVRTLKNSSRPRKGDGADPTTTDMIDHEMYSGIVSTYEDQLRRMQQENDYLRTSLRSMTRELHHLLIPQSDDEEEMSGEGSVLGNRSAVFDLPIEFLQERLDAHMATQLRRVREALGQLDLDASISNVSGIAPDNGCDVAQQLQLCKQIISDQQEIIHYAAARDDDEDVSEGTPSFSAFEHSDVTQHPSTQSSFGRELELSDEEEDDDSLECSFGEGKGTAAEHDNVREDRSIPTSISSKLSPIQQRRKGRA
eukprot:TRINITY_DN1074_c0_g1_i1.p1 TRINITY_DN1074_c0_g1~~TRINITY_DN1074_c0_g1_i1.p1  ORF type:complete len:493 (-),score=123.68 TRINITY_DN1074_c0_g1_i1:276-1754(-)